MLEPLARLSLVHQVSGCYVIAPYNEYPQLLGLLLKLINGELVWSTRREVLKVLGIFGALDPNVQKRIQHSLPGSHGEGARVASDTGQHVQSMYELPMNLWPSFATSRDYYSTVCQKLSNDKDSSDDEDDQEKNEGVQEDMSQLDIETDESFVIDHDLFG